MPNRKQREKARQARQNKNKKVNLVEITPKIEDEDHNNQQNNSESSIQGSILNLGDDLLSIIINSISMSSLFMVLGVCKQLNNSIKTLWNQKTLKQRPQLHQNWEEFISFHAFEYFKSGKKIPFSHITVNKNGYEVIRRKGNSIICKRVKTYNSTLSPPEITIPLDILFSCSQKTVSYKLLLDKHPMNFECQIDPNYPKLPEYLRTDSEIYDKTYMFAFNYNLTRAYMNTGKIVTSLAFKNLVSTQIKNNQYVTQEDLVHLLCEHITPFKTMKLSRVQYLCAMFFQQYKSRF
tara:strand:- start:935 stop:1810 length:876 start_codon:yes stop_codon:yes gene_type:complete